MKILWQVAVLIFLFLAGCATQKVSSPEINKFPVRVVNIRDATTVSRVDQQLAYANSYLIEASIYLYLVKFEECSFLIDLDAAKLDALANKQYISVYYFPTLGLWTEGYLVSALSSFPEYDELNRYGIFISTPLVDAHIFTHEIGHYFGLRHTFDDEENISDTLSKEEWGELTRDNYMLYDNIMNYTLHRTGSFTQGQIDAMRQFAELRRKDSLPIVD